MTKRTRSRLSLAIAASLAVVAITAVCDTTGILDSGNTDVDRFLEAIEAIENGASIQILDKIIGSRKPWTIIFIDEGSARWHEYIRGSEASGSGYWGAGGPGIGAFGMLGAGMLGDSGMLPSQEEDAHDAPTCSWEHGDTVEETREYLECASENEDCDREIAFESDGEGGVQVAYIHSHCEEDPH